MYSDTDLAVILNGYFIVLSLQVDSCILKSKNTRHSWKIQQSDDGYYILLHKHNDYDKFHFQRGCASIEDSILEIVEHDEYQLRGRRHEPRKGRTYFDEILDIYRGS